MARGSVTVNGVTLELHPSGPRGWKADDANDWAEEVSSGGAIGGPSTPVSAADVARLRYAEDGRLQISEDAADYKSALRGVDTYDIRDLGSGGVLTGDSDKDTQALEDAVDLVTNDSDGSNSRPGVVLFPRGQLLLESQLSLYGTSATASSWVGQNGRSRGPDGTEIKWAGGAVNAPMLHCYGLNAFTFDNIAFNGDSLARFCVWAESNERNGGAGSSGVKWRDCVFTSPGERGVGMICGDELRRTLTLSGVTGSFTPGEYVLDNYLDSLGTVVSYSAPTLVVKEIIGGGFATNGGTLTGLTSGATATLDGQSVVSGYSGNRQFSEAVWDHCMFQGSGSVNGWAGWATFGANNNKNYTLIHPSFDQTRYGIDGGYGSGYLTVTNPTGANIGQSQKGAICRAGGYDLLWENGNFENGGSGRARVFDLSNVKADIIGGEYYGDLPTDNYAVKGWGIINIQSVSFGADTGIPAIQLTGGTLNLDGVNWREDFSGYLPIYDGSDNPLGLSGTADYARGIDSCITARGCVANCNDGISGQRKLPDLYARPLSPHRNQLCDDGVTGITVDKRGILSRSVETRTIPYTKVAAGASVTFAKNKAKSTIAGIVLDVTQTFRGGAISSMTLKIGDGTTQDLYIAAKDVYTATGQFSQFTPALAPWAGGSVVATFTAGGAAVAALTQGSVTVYVIYEVLT